MTPWVDVANMTLSTELGAAFPWRFVFPLMQKFVATDVSTWPEANSIEFVFQGCDCRYNPRSKQLSGLVMYSTTIGSHRYSFRNLANLLAKASPLRSGDQLAGLSADTD